MAERQGPRYKRDLLDLDGDSWHILRKVQDDFRGKDVDEFCRATTGHEIFDIRLLHKIETPRKYLMISTNVMEGTTKGFVFEFDEAENVAQLRVYRDPDALSGMADEDFQVVIHTPDEETFPEPDDLIDFRIAYLGFITGQHKASSQHETGPADIVR